MRLVVLNPRAHGGEALERWKRVAHLVPATVEEGDCKTAVARAIGDGCREFVAAGGDGTLNLLVNAILECRGERPLAEFTIGAVGLGSSNDFHKPFIRMEGGIPLRIDASRSAPHDVGEVTYDGARRHFLVGVGFGAIAEGNALFNAGGGVLGWLKRRWTGGAIAWAAARAMLQHRNVAARLDAGPKSVIDGFSNAAITKGRYLSGTLHFDTGVERDDGLLAVNVLAPMGRLRLVEAFFQLQRGRFGGLPGRIVAQSPEVRIEADRPIAAEIDGEIVEARVFEIRVLPEKIRVCG